MIFISGYARLSKGYKSPTAGTRDMIFFILKKWTKVCGEKKYLSEITMYFDMK